MSELNRQVLVLNKMWMPIRLIPAHRAMSLIFAGKASFVDAETNFVYGWNNWIKEPIKESDAIISSSRGDIKVPDMIVLYSYDKVFRKDVRLTKRNIYIRDGYRCQYTGEKLK